MCFSLYNNTWYVCWQMQSPRLELETRMALRNPTELHIGTMSDVKIGLQVFMLPSLKLLFHQQPHKLHQPPKTGTLHLTHKVSSLPCSSCMYSHVESLFL